MAQLRVVAPPFEIQSLPKLDGVVAVRLRDAEGTVVEYSWVRPDDAQARYAELNFLRGQLQAGISALAAGHRSTAGRKPMPVEYYLDGCEWRASGSDESAWNTIGCFGLVGFVLLFIWPWVGVLLLLLVGAGIALALILSLVGAVVAGVNSRRDLRRHHRRVVRTDAVAISTGSSLTGVGWLTATSEYRKFSSKAVAFVRLNDRVVLAALGEDPGGAVGEALSEADRQLQIISQETAAKQQQQAAAEAASLAISEAERKAKLEVPTLPQGRKDGG